jgi:ribosomal protein S18 acetylase RimI-like enzyme
MNTIDNRYKIKIAKEKDIPDLTRMLFDLRSHMFRNNGCLWQYTSQRKSDQPIFYQKMIANPDILLLTVFDSISNSNIGLGFGWIIKNEQYEIGKYGQIGDVWIDPNHRRKGLCKKLISKLINFFDASEIESISLDYAHGNREAEQVWSNLGFKKALITSRANLADIKDKNL